MAGIKKIFVEHRLLFIGLIVVLFLVYSGKLSMRYLENKINPAKAELEKLNAEKINLVKEIDLIKGKESLLKEQEKKLTEYFILKSRVGNISNSSRFFKDITNFKKMVFNSLKPTKKEQISQYLKMEITLNITGSYEDLEKYIKYLDELPYIISVKKLDFSKTNGKNINITMVIDTVGI